MRTTAVQNRAPQTLMISLAKSASDSEIAAAAAYFSSLKPRDRIRVVETDVVPKTFVAGWFLECALAEELGDGAAVDGEVDFDREQRGDDDGFFGAGIGWAKQCGDAGGWGIRPD